MTDLQAKTLTLRRLRVPLAVHSALVSMCDQQMRTFADIYAEAGEDWKDQLEQRAKEAAYIARFEHLVRRFLLDGEVTIRCNDL